MNIATDDLIPSVELIAANGIGNGPFREIGDGMAHRFKKLGLIQPSGVTVDIGCGLGRLARPLTSVLSGQGEYYGFDINRSSIEWCKERYARFPNFKFEWMDLHSIYYNKDGKTPSKDYVFPLRDDFADFINLTSVFTHMFIDDVKGYLKEIARILRPGRKCFITYFLVDDSIDEWVKKTYHKADRGYYRDKDLPETMILLNEPDIVELYKEVGLEIQDLNYGSWAKAQRPKEIKGGYQDEIIAIKK